MNDWTKRNTRTLKTVEGGPFGDLNSLRVTVHRLIDTLHLFDFHYQEHIIARVLLKDKFVLGDSYQT